MTARYHTSAPPERAFMTRKSWQHPGRRRHVHGEIRPLHDDPEPLWAWVIIVGLALVAAYLTITKGWWGW